MGVTTRKGVAGELSLHQNALLLPQTFPYCPGTCVCSAEVPPWSCRDPEKLSLAHLWSACGGQLETQHRDKQAVLYPPWHPLELAQKGIQLQHCCPPWGRAGYFRARTACKCFISPVLGVAIVGFQMTSAGKH